MSTPIHLTAISNMHVLETLVQPSQHMFGGSEKVWRFAETPIMSTYLVNISLKFRLTCQQVALIVGEFDVVSNYTKEGVLVNVYTPIGKSAQGAFALDGKFSYKMY